MTSPFSTYQEYYEAEGAIYTFSNNPMLLGIVLVAAALVFVYFIYSTYTIKKEPSNAQNPIVLSLLVLTSAATLIADTIYTQYQKQSDRPLSSEVHSPTNQPSQFQPLAFLGLVGSATAVSRRRKRGRDRYKSRRTSGKIRLR